MVGEGALRVDAQGYVETLCKRFRFLPKWKGRVESEERRWWPFANEAQRERFITACRSEGRSRSDMNETATSDAVLLRLFEKYLNLDGQEWAPPGHGPMKRRPVPFVVALLRERIAEKQALKGR